MTEPDEQAEVAMQARMAAENAGLMANDLPEQGPHLVEAEPYELDEDGSIVDVEEMIPTKPENVINVDDISTGSGDPGADYEGELLDHEGASSDQITGGLSNEDADQDYPNDYDHESDTEEDNLPRRSK